MFSRKLRTYYQAMNQVKAKQGLLLGLLVSAVLLGNILTSAMDNLFHVLPKGEPLQSFLAFHVRRYVFVYLILLVGAYLVYHLLWLKVRINYESLEEGQKATSRFATVDELIAQYKTVPIKAKYSEATYGGLSGTIVGRQKDQLFLDTDPAYNYILGRSRPAKGQTKVLPDMDVYSRSEEKPHLIIASGKYELAVAEMNEFQRRGYETSVLNLVHLDRSILYNCLDLIKQSYLANDIDNAIELCKTFSYPLYHNAEAREPVWEETAMALVNAVILALCYEFIENSEHPEETEKYVSMYAVANMLIELGTPDESGDTLLDQYFSGLPTGNPAKMEYSTVQYASGQMRASIFASTQAKLRHFTAPKVAKMMRQSTFDFHRLTKDRTPIDRTTDICITGTVDVEKEGTYELCYEITNEFHDRITCQRTVTVTNEADTQALPNAHAYFSGVDHVVIPLHTPFDSRKGVSCTYYYKPQAVFLVLPDYIQTNYIIATTWISQMYHVLSDFASTCPGDTLRRRVRVILDEFGNLPMFSNMASMLSVGAGRGILFDFYVQHPNQLRDKYGEKVGEMIEDEAMNYFFLMTRSKRAREDFSALLGKKEITVQTRSGGVFDLNKTVTETVETVPLMDDYKLGRLEEGEVIVDRSIHRKNLKGEPIVPYPIHNKGEHGKLVYAHRYLSDQFDPTGNWEELALHHVSDIPLEEYSKEFVARIKSPLAQRADEQNEKKNEREREAIMREPESVLDPIYTGIDGEVIATEMEKITPIYLQGERKSLIEVYGSDHVYTICDMLVSFRPKDEAIIETLEYYEEYLDYLQQASCQEVYEELQYLGYFV